MTTGELLVSLSGLSGVSAMAHLQGVDVSGTGGETIYAPWVTVWTTQECKPLFAHTAVDSVFIALDSARVFINETSAFCVAADTPAVVVSQDVVENVKGSYPQLRVVSDKI